MPDEDREKEADTPRRRTRRSGGDAEKVGAAVQDGYLQLTVTEMLISTTAGRGEYQRNKVYGHLAVTPAVPWVVKIHVGDLEGTEAIRKALEEIQGVVTDAVADTAKKLADRDKEELKASVDRSVSTSDGGRYATRTEVKTQISDAPSGVSVRPSVQAAVEEEPPPAVDDEDHR